MQLSFSAFESAQPLAEPGPTAGRGDFCDLLAHFDQFGSRGKQLVTFVEGHGRLLPIPTFVNEFWTARQRAAHSLHEVSYRACFKPQLPRFFIERLSRPGETVYDPFMGRGTTLVEAGLLGRRPLGCDINPLSRVLVRPRLNPPECSEIEGRISAIDFSNAAPLPDALLVFYHPETLRELCALREYFRARAEDGRFDRVDQWIQMVAVNRLTGHSPGFFSVYTLPPNQAVSLQSQARINAKRGQTPPRRSVPALILRKSRSLLSDGVERLRAPGAWNEDDAILLNRQSHSTPEIASDSVRLVVTSPPFLDVVDYVTDNWLRCWFCDIELNKELMSVSASLANWEAEMRAVLQELRRVLRPDGHIAFEVGEVRRGSIRLEENVARLGCEAGLEPLCILINEQHFTKTSNCWGVLNQQLGTNSNRIVVFRK